MRTSYYCKTFPKRKKIVIENIQTGKDKKKNKKQVEIRLPEVPHEKLAGLKKRPKKLKIKVSCRFVK